MTVTTPERLPQQPYGAPPPGYGPPYAPQYGQPPVAPRPKKPPMSTRNVALIVAACVAGGSLVMALGIFGLRAMQGSSSGASDRTVRMVGCRSAGRIVGAEAEVEVTNQSSRTRSYTVTVSFTDSSGSTQYATGTAFIRDVAPGQSGRGTAASWRGGESSISNCKITTVSQSGF